MLRFYWLESGVVAGCSLPGGDSGRWPAAHGGALDRDLEELRQQGIGAILTLTEDALDADTLAAHGLETLHLPVPDMTAPLPAQVQQALEFIDRQRVEGRAVAVHCLMGQGRTGTILAAYLIRDGMPAEEAIGRLRQICPGAIESGAQRESLRRFAERRDWVL
jgi:atypical dual specificity phosphatase